MTIAIGMMSGYDSSLARGARTSQQQPSTSLWWNTNIPEEHHTSTCPPYLLYALHNAKDRSILSTPDHLYNRQTWPEVQRLVRENRLEDFTRVPSELRAYRQFCVDVSESHGSVLNFILKERLRWEMQSTDARREMSFEDPTAYKTLRNDWPYGFDPRIVHLVVWTKFALPIDPGSAVGDMSTATKETIQCFVDKTFGQVKEKVWFKNWAALKSVHAVEHFHVLLFHPDHEFVRKVTT